MKKLFLFLFIFVFFIFFAKNVNGAEVLNFQVSATSSVATFPNNYRGFFQTFNIGDHCSVSSISVYAGANFTSQQGIRLYEGVATSTVLKGLYNTSVAKACTINSWCNLAFVPAISNLKKNTLYSFFWQQRSTTALTLYYSSINYYADGNYYDGDYVNQPTWDIAFRIYYNDSVDQNCYTDNTCSISTSSKTMLLENITYNSTTTAITASTSVLTGQYDIPFFLYFFVLTGFSFTILFIWFMYYLFNEK